MIIYQETCWYNFYCSSLTIGRVSNEGEWNVSVILLINYFIYLSFRLDLQWIFRDYVNNWTWESTILEIRPVNVKEERMRLEWLERIVAETVGGINH